MLYLGIDGGGTGCRALLAEAGGAPLGLGEGGPANIATNPETALANVLGAAKAAAAQAGLAPELLAQATAVLGLAGANLALAATDFSARLAAAGALPRARLVSDAVTAAAGALRGAEGIVAGIGTGSFYVRARAGEMVQVGGHGFRLGDQGSGAALGRALLVEALRAADGLRPLTPLLAAALGELGGIEGIIAFGLSALPADYARFAPRIVAGDDPAGEAIFAAAVAEAEATIAHLQAGGAAVPVVWLGGLGPAYATRLSHRFDTRPALGTGLDGALWLARQEGGI